LDRLSRASCRCLLTVLIIFFITISVNHIGVCEILNSLAECCLFRFLLDFLSSSHAFFDALSVFSLGQVLEPRGRFWSPGTPFFVFVFLFFSRWILGALDAILGSILEAKRAPNLGFGVIFGTSNFFYFFLWILEGPEPRKSSILLRKTNGFHEIHLSKKGSILR